MSTQPSSSPNNSDPIFQDLTRPRLSDAERRLLQAAAGIGSERPRPEPGTESVDATKVRLTDAERSLLEAAYSAVEGADRPKPVPTGPAEATKVRLTDAERALLEAARKTASPAGNQPDTRASRDKLTEAERELLSVARETVELTPTEAIRADEPLRDVCPQCGQTAEIGALLCSHCGTLFTFGGKTHRLNIPFEPPLPGNRAVGDVFVGTHRPIVFEINGKRTNLPITDSLIIGRASRLPGDVQPDVNLNSCDAEEKGVSRQHIRITRKRDLIYVADIGSTNGTFLNGMRLTCNSERVLRNGDELRLGHLKIRVTF